MFSWTKKCQKVEGNKSEKKANFGFKIYFFWSKYVDEKEELPGLLYLLQIFALNCGLLLPCLCLPWLLCAMCCVASTLFGWHSMLVKSYQYSAFVYYQILYYTVCYLKIVQRVMLHFTFSKEAMIQLVKGQNRTRIFETPQSLSQWLTFYLFTL